MPRKDVGLIEQEESEKPAWCDSKTIIQMLILPLLLLLCTQIVTTILPIMFGPTDTSDFNINVEPPAGDLELNNPILKSEIIVEDLNHWLRPYSHSVHLEAILPTDLKAYFENNNLKPPFETTITIYPVNRSKNQKVEIMITALGGDGKRRNATLLVCEPTPQVDKPFSMSGAICGGGKLPFNR
jgi:hypothetical protein